MWEGSVPGSLLCYITQGTLQFFSKEYDKAIATYQQGLKYEPDNAELREGIERCYEAISR